MKLSSFLIHILKGVVYVARDIAKYRMFCYPKKQQHFYMILKMPAYRFVHIPNVIIKTFTKCQSDGFLCEFTKCI